MTQQQEFTQREKGLLKVASRHRRTVEILEYELQKTFEGIYEYGGLSGVLKYGEKTTQWGKAQIYTVKGTYTNKKGETHDAHFNLKGKYLGKWNGKPKVTTEWLVMWNDPEYWDYQVGVGFVGKKTLTEKEWEEASSKNYKKKEEEWKKANPPKKSKKKLVVVDDDE